MNKIIMLMLLIPFLALASEDKKLYGEYIGYLLYERSLKDVEVDFQDVLNGFKYATQKIPPKISEEQAFEIYLTCKKEQFDHLCTRNLQKANAFLKEISVESEEVIPGKVYMKILQDSQGEGLISSDCGNFKLKAYRFQEEPFYENKEGVTQSMDTAIEGFGKGVVGMKIGEKRIIYIHPDLAYSTYDLIHPNSLIIIEVERLPLIKS